MRDLIRKLVGRTYYPLNRVEINRQNLISNYRLLSNINKKIKIAPVLKSNAYGHGLVEVARIVDSLSPPFICVDSLYEAYELYKAKIRSKILIMGYIDPKNLKVKKLPFAYAVYDLKLLDAIDKYQSGADIHIKLDTGMNRLGIKVADLPVFLKHLASFKPVNVEGFMSHFARAQNSNDEIAKEQIKKFKKALTISSSFGFRFKWKHIASSSSLLNLNPKTLSEISNLARVGLALYGIDENPKSRLKPVLSLVSKIVQIKYMNVGELIGYNGTFVAKRSMKIGLLPLGYNDGVDRRLSNKGVVKVGGRYCRIVGMVSMNICAIDLSGLAEVHEGDEVIVFSGTQSDKNSIARCAQAAGTIPYDILVGVNPTIKRQII